MYSLIVHGGAGRAPRDPAGALAGVQRAAEAGRAVLMAGGGALAAVVAAVVVLEDDPQFNAGTGAVLNSQGEVEADAGVMAGEGLRTGNVAALVGVRNPVLVARRLLDLDGPVLLAGAGAQRFARAAGFPPWDPVTEERRAEWQAARAALARGEGQADLLRLGSALPQLFCDTVGAVALDPQGGTAAATSTGGIALKLPGRVGDSPVPGAGNYAAPEGAASATGRGELMLRFLTAKGVCDRIAAGTAPQAAVEQVIAAMAAGVGGEVGLIALDRAGRIGIAHATPAMVHAWCREGEPVQCACTAPARAFPGSGSGSEPA